MVRSLRVLLALAVGLVAAAQSVSAQERKLVVYTANYRVSDALVAAYQKLNPGVKVSAVSGSTGPIAERTVAEMRNPQADIVYLFNGQTLERLRDAGVFQPYRPRNAAIPDEHMDPDGFFTLHMFNSMVMLVNKERLARRKLPMPTTWAHLLNPAFKGEITVASPIKSGTGVTIYLTLLDAFGWNFIEHLDANVFAYNDGGGSAGQQAGAGEISIGLTHDAAAFEQVAAGRPVEIVFPDILPSNFQGGGLVKGAPNVEEGKRFLDFLATREAAEIMSPFVTATTVPGISRMPEGHRVIWGDPKRPIDQRAFLDEWKKRFPR